MAAQVSYSFQGKEFTIWNAEQLTAINRTKLKQRAMDIREHVGADCLPSMPQHPEELVRWIMDVQAGLMGREPAAFAAYAQLGRGHQQQQQQQQHQPQQWQQQQQQWQQQPGVRVPPSAPASVACSEDLAAYRDASKGARAARDRNRGSGIF
mmetsp:Transcript_27304/g.76822  ORF Transcript_27304/g.76822 Transcript_27304/m.76822 type:complete len:152 (-) Transcript_27304:119-574(-)